MAMMSFIDSMFLHAETRESPMHVGGLQVYRLPPRAGRKRMRATYQELLAAADVHPLFKRRPRRAAASLSQWEWIDDEDFDLEFHVRHSALPRPGGIKELLALVSRLHGTALDRERPLWEFHLIEGLAGGRFATYTKIHHAVVDGVSALRLLGQALSEDPDGQVSAPWAIKPAAPPKSSSREPRGALDFLSGAAGALGELAGVGAAMFRNLQRGLRDQLAATPFQAPPSILNVPITGARRFAADGWSLERIRAVGKAAHATVNDVVLAMCAGALRRYLAELDALPEQPLIAMVPVSLRSDQGLGGNAVGSVLCNLATNVEDPAERLRQIVSSMKQGKASLSGLTPLQSMIVSATMMSPMVLFSALGGTQRMRPTFNVTISNVPGPKKALYWKGARLEGIYPLSIPFHGQALNVTVASYVNELDFGITGCRRRMPHLQRMLGHLETSLAELEPTHFR